ncbi:Rhodanese-like domain-containing protein 10 [Hibiscus syriacus]|uniref:Rhodanese-like domain-containing protein 10 n=1 Tax=Hibiscus syriacus TaxID=106335 RepID=A0A6A3BPW3_HIBSY|nr:rhodanese-like domain-containing protein 10 [Hibiscus syriacus]KAE8717388.1 Rhodanese-like domain-containing protein 10 [Hibiscus syriacus]
MAVQLNHFRSSLLKQEKQPKPPLFTSYKTRTIRLNTAASSSIQQLIQSGEVKPIPPKDAATALNSDGFKLLDIRPQWEREKAYVKGSLHVPLFVKDTDNSPVTLLKKWVHFGYIGLWTGQNLTMINPDFVQEVDAAVSNDRDAKMLVACGEGLRSMMATSKLYDGGYKNLGWLAGGFNRSADSDFPEVEGPEKLQYATIGGVSYYFLKLLLLLQAVGKE